MKRILMIICCLCFVWRAAGQHQTDFTITDLDNKSLASEVQGTLSRLVSELNLAHQERRNPRLRGLKMEEAVKNSIAALWETSPFRCVESEVVESALLTYSKEYEVRNIPFIFSAMSSDDQYHEAAVTFNNQGVITSFHMVIAQNLYYQVMRSKHGVTDLRRRQMILDYVEQFRTAYNTKDIGFLNQIFSDDALIITGKVVKVKPNEMDVPYKITYKKQGKKEYLTNLKRVFDNNERIKVSFDEIEVMRHPINTDFYGVTLHQNFFTSNYMDDGYVFLLWDFTNPDQPQIHVRTWQPDKIGDKKLPEDEIFSVHDFEI